MFLHIFYLRAEIAGKNHLCLQRTFSDRIEHLGGAAAAAGLRNFGILYRFE